MRLTPNTANSMVELAASTKLHSFVGQIQTNSKPLLSDILQGKSKLPLANRDAMTFLQSKDKDLTRVKELLMVGQRPSTKRDPKTVKMYFRSDVNTSVDS